MLYLDKKFEELPSFVREGFYSGSHNGSAEIAFSREGDWYVTGLSLECDNRRNGQEAQSKLIDISWSGDSALWSGLVSSLHTLLGDSIEEDIAEHLTLISEAAE